MMTKEEWDKFSSENKYNLYKHLRDLIQPIIDLKDKPVKDIIKEVDKKEIDVSNLFVKDYGPSMINPLNKKQVMYIDEDGFNFITNDKEYISLEKSVDWKAVLTDCEFKDLKVGDFFRYTKSDFEQEDKELNKDIRLITNIEDGLIAFIMYEKNFLYNLFYEDVLFDDEYYKYQKVVLKEK